MTDRVLADAVVITHAAFVAFVVAGGFLVLRWPRVAWIHLPAVVWGAALELVGLECPLTPLENALRARAGRSPYAGGFVEHHVLPLLYPDDLTRNVQLALGTAVLVVNALVYARVLASRDRTRGDAAP